MSFKTASPHSPREVSNILDDAFAELCKAPFIQVQLGLPLVELPDLSFAEAQRRSAVGRHLLERLQAINVDDLSREMALSLRAVRFRALFWAREADWYWIVVDPGRLGFFGLFLPTAYCGAQLLNSLNRRLAGFPISGPSEAQHYLKLVGEYSHLIDQFVERSSGQAQRGIRMPKVQAIQARTLLSKFKSGLRPAICSAARHASSSEGSSLLGELEACIATRIEPAFDRALGFFSDGYLRAAPEEVGCGQYPDGTEVYAELLKFHTTLDMTPAQVHAHGLECLAEIESRKQAIRSELGFEGDDVAFVDNLNRNPSWRASTAEGVAAVFKGYLDRVSPKMSGYFEREPKAPCKVSPLPDALQGAMTYGYFEPAGRHDSVGRYFFNAKNLTRQALYALGALTYHELIPGHHHQISLQYENECLHPFRRYSLPTAYVEGWAEYAATLAGEMGLYECAEERYGRLANEAFLAGRLVVDTGMNMFRWPLQRAREFLRQRCGMSEAESFSEAVRYSCDIPAQALAYKLGEQKFLELRERMRTSLGDRFDMKEFHNVVLSTGAIPLPELEWHMDREIESAMRRNAHLDEALGATTGAQ